MSKSNGELDRVLCPLAVVYLGVGVILALVGYGTRPLLVAAGVLLLLKTAFDRLERTGSSLPEEIG